MKSQLKLNGTVIKTPHQFKIERYNITSAKRLSSGRMQMDLIAKKRKFFCTWEAITAAELNTILNIIWETNSVMFTLSYVENNVVKSATVYAGALPSTLFRTDDLNWIWTDVQINFIEQ